MSWPSSKILCEIGGVEIMLLGYLGNIIVGGVEIISSQVPQYQ
jgi:hypothetical protein